MVITHKYYFLAIPILTLMFWTFIETLFGKKTLTECLLLEISMM
jgi:hypothetical protein